VKSPQIENPKNHNYKYSLGVKTTFCQDFLSEHFDIAGTTFKVLRAHALKQRPVVVSVNLFLFWLYLHDIVQLLVNSRYDPSNIPRHVPDSTSWRAELFVKQKHTGGKPFEILRVLKSPT
jgi:hypothetical protein